MVEAITKIGSEVKNAATTNDESSGSKRLFMKSKLTWHTVIVVVVESNNVLYVLLADMVDPLKKREEFAVSLRKQKKIELIRNKRMKLMQNTAKMP